MLAATDWTDLDAVPPLSEADVFEKTEPFAIVRLGLPE